MLIGYPCIPHVLFSLPVAFKLSINQYCLCHIQDLFGIHLFKPLIVVGESWFIICIVELYDLSFRCLFHIHWLLVCPVCMYHHSYVLSVYYHCCHVLSMYTINVGMCCLCVSSLLLCAVCVICMCCLCVSSLLLCGVYVFHRCCYVVYMCIITSTRILHINFA